MPDGDKCSKVYLVGGAFMPDGGKCSKVYLVSGGPGAKYAVRLDVVSPHFFTALFKFW
jgi:hypothetical protein